MSRTKSVGCASLRVHAGSVLLAICSSAAASAAPSLASPPNGDERVLVKTPIDEAGPAMARLRFVGESPDATVIPEFDHLRVSLSGERSVSGSDGMPLDTLSGQTNAVPGSSLASPRAPSTTEIWTGVGLIAAGALLDKPFDAFAASCAR